MTWRFAAELVVTIAEALNHAHKQGIFHRVGKPGNIMSDLINWLHPLGADPQRLAAELRSPHGDARTVSASARNPMDATLFDPQTSTRRALILALGHYGEDGLPAAWRAQLTDKLVNLYRDDHHVRAGGTVVDLFTSSTSLSDTTPHNLRGGGFVDVPGHLRSAQRIWNLPFNRLGVYGLRIARTCP